MHDLRNRERRSTASPVVTKSATALEVTITAYVISVFAGLECAFCFGCQAIALASHGDRVPMYAPSLSAFGSAVHFGASGPKPAKGCCGVPAGALRGFHSTEIQ